MTTNSGFSPSRILGNVSQTAYDGQDHAIATFSPMNEILQFIYDGITTCFTPSTPWDSPTNSYMMLFQFDPDSDARGNSSRFGYNAQFFVDRLRTNGAGTGHVQLPH